MNHFTKLGLPKFVFLSLRNKTPSNYKFPISFLEQSLGDEKFYVKAVNSGLPTYFSGNIDKIHLVLWEEINHFGIVNYTEIGRDTVALKAVETHDKWIIPSGWWIERTLVDPNDPYSERVTFTTMAPAEGAIGPKTEGNSIATNNGYTYSKYPWQYGFVLAFDYSFTRNTTPDRPTGYLQPDICKNSASHNNEQIDDDDTKKVSFVGNSGIKLGGYGSYQATRDGITEVAILDMWAMVNLMPGNNAQEKMEFFKERINNTTGMVEFSKFTFPDNSKLPYDDEHISKLMNGVVYGDDEDIKACIVGASGKTYQDLFVENYNYFSGNGGLLLIEHSDDGTLTVHRYTGNGHFAPYYVKSSVPITGTYEKKNPDNSTDTVTRDGRVYIQSHWGSGVTFDILTFEEPN